MLEQFPAGLRNLVILICLFGLGQIALPRVGFHVDQLYLSYFSNPDFRPWQLVTHIFCHGGFGHFLFNTIALISFGSVMEHRLGTRRFLYLFFISAFGAVLVQYISQAVLLAQHNNGDFLLSGELKYKVNDVMQDVRSQMASGKQVFVTNEQLGYLELGKIFSSKMLGASGAIYGVLIGFVFFYPNERLIFLFIPYPIKAKILVPILLLVDIVGGFGQFNWDPVAHFAHVGGALAGYVTLRIWAWNRIKNNWQ